MIGTGDRNRPLAKTGHWLESPNGNSPSSAGTEDLRSRAELLSLCEKLERNRFLLERLSASSTRLIQALELGDLYEATAEIIANLIGSEEVAIFPYSSASKTFSLAWSWGVERKRLLSRKMKPVAWFSVCRAEPFFAALWTKFLSSRKWLRDKILKGFVTGPLEG